MQEFHRVMEKAAVSYYDRMMESTLHEESRKSDRKVRKKEREVLKENRAWNITRIQK